MHTKLQLINSQQVKKGVMIDTQECDIAHIYIFVTFEILTLHKWKKQAAEFACLNRQLRKN